MMKSVRNICVLLLLLFSFAFMAGCGKRESPVEDFRYEIEDGHIVITEYIGTDREIVIPSEIENRPVTIIGEDAFREYDLVSIVMPDSIVRIREQAFQECECLETVVFSESLETIERYAFLSCSSLTEANFSDSLKSIGASAFSRCESLEKVNLPDGLEGIDETSFQLCSSLQGLEIPENTYIHR